MSQFLNTTGIYPWYLERGIDLVHPEDLESFSGLSPAARVFHVVGERDGYLTLRYGADTFRVKPDLYRPVPNVEYKIGDVAIVLAAGSPKTGEICDVQWHFQRSEPFYHLKFNGKRSSRRYWPQELARSTDVSRQHE